MGTVHRLATLIGAALLVIATALAPRAEAGAADEAKRAYKEGVSHFESGRFTEAADAFRTAHELKPSWKLLYNIGQSEAAAKRYGLALDAFEKYMVEGGDGVPEDRREEVLSEVQRLRVLVGVVEVSGGEGIELVVDGVSRGETPFEGPVRVAAGEREIALRRGDEVLLERMVNIAGGMTTVLEPAAPAAPVEPEPPEEQPEQPVQTPPDEDRQAPVLLIAGISCGVLGLGGIALGSYGAYLGARDYEDYEGAVNAADWDAVDELEDEVLPRDRALTGVGFGVGGALLAAGVVLIVIDQTRDDEEPQAVTVLPAPGGMSLTF